MYDLAKEIWQTMSTNKLRTFLTGISVAWGILMLILLLSISQGVTNMTTGFTAKNDPFRITVWAGSTSLPWHGFKEGRQILLRARDMETVAKANENITAVEGNLRLMYQVSTQKDYLSSRVNGSFPERFNGRYTLKQGRFLNDADIKQQRKVAVIDTKSAATLYDDTTHVVGQYLRIGPSIFTVVGVYSHEWEDIVIIPFTTAYAMNGYQDNLWQNDVHISENVTDSEVSAQIEQDVRRAYGKALNFDPKDENAIWTFDRFAGSQEQLKGNRILTMAMWLIGILTLITGIVGVSNIMFVSVKERTHEIGIRRAIGAKPRKILAQIIMESIALTTVFGYIGIIAGVAVVEAVKYALTKSTIQLRPDVDIVIAVEVLIALVIAGALAGIFPAYKATKVSPVEALRDE